ncbi:hypothetical protein HPB50_010336 [Hyalomma asiaticum]|uniref:Uncharacterized protein n=1 Tax=Hyalomma asiaticum TaxID=266040 RepID=A0ACB7SM80_HYAAI|nr:hypothetical protein HPB50_010336 [Hyalomma asiaticum]
MYGKVEDPSSRAAYCQFTDMLFPEAVSLSKLYLRAKRGCKLMQNFEVLREALEQVGINREVPVE